MPATVTLDKDNYVIIGEEIDGEYIEQFGQILDFRADERRADLHWLKIKMLVDVRNNTLIERIQNYNSDALKTIPKLETFVKDEGEQIHAHFRSRIEARDEGAGARPGARRGTRLAPAVRVREIGEDVEEEGPAEEAPRQMGLMPQPVQESEDNDEEVMKDFSINLETGDMKTVMAVGEKSPAKVFAVIDRAIEENGHVVLNYISSNLRSAFIDLKIESLKSYGSLELEKNSVYIISEGEHKAEAVYLGGQFWIIPDSTSDISGLTTGFLDIKPNMLKGYSIVKVEGEDDIKAVLATVEPTFNQIDQDMLDFLEAQPGQTIEITFAEAISTINSELLGEKWVDAITYFYFMGGALKWKNLELSTFSTADSIKELATSKKDTNVLEMLQAA